MSEARNALVTGGTRGLGLAVARRLAAEGWSTTVFGLDQGRLEKVRAMARSEGLDLHAVRADVTSEESVRQAVADLTRTRPLHLCVNNAGRNLSRLLLRTPRDGGGELLTHPLDDWERTLRLCLTGVFLVGREAAASMVRHEVPGVIVNVSSGLACGAYGQSAYTAAKAGVEALTRTWSYELGPYGIRVVAVAPGVMDGEALREKSTAFPRHARYMEGLKRFVPLGRWAAEDEIADAVCFAADNPYLTGSVIRIDGGGPPGWVP
ncbi:SDR family NAD(P)-dependent oxidoreductase [Streptomyces sp. DSM 41921]|uniref:SDR family NAD(P)-dependent oxidoreductase n=1 Tax=Streptomyces dubilierae TaxID=3075533 RepID=A0ABU2PMS4_9ACTN|nr:SDR family NAD(P)-dependent oxidoreductase [Streptomyces sp. DSM 41921]MDT0392070.1 SDR family NAD(P)-dependent oxidoreductase [Streptomyces sp. DSM 41921]